MSACHGKVLGWLAGSVCAFGLLFSQTPGTPLPPIQTNKHTVDGKHATEDEFVTNFSMAQKRLQEAVPAALDFVFGRTVQDL